MTELTDGEEARALFEVDSPGLFLWEFQDDLKFITTLKCAGISLIPHIT